MTEAEAIRLRGYNFALGALANQMNNPLCANCMSFANTASGALRGLEEFLPTVSGLRRRWTM